MPRFGVLGTYPPALCGLASFGAALSAGLEANGADVSVVRVADGAPSSDARVIGELINGSPRSIAACAGLLSQCDIAVIQHDFGVYGGPDGDEHGEAGHGRFLHQLEAGPAADHEHAVR